MYKVFLFFLVALATSSFAASVNTSSLFNRAHVSPRSLRIIATEGKKLFFADQTEGTWNASSEYCESYGYKLATIRSQQEFKALDAAYSTGSFNGWHWVAGRDAGSIKQFVWDEDGKEVDNNLLFDLVKWSPKRCACLAFNSVLGSSYLSSLNCSSPRVFPICETTIP